jgi:hypothetical protein
MSDNPLRLELLGEMIRRLQADIRTMRDEIKSLRHDASHGFELITERIANHEAVTQSRLDQIAEVLFAIADKTGVDMRRSVT